MQARSPQGVRGFEYDWIASDGDGHVAFFSTAGGGYPPKEFLRDTEAHDRAIASILEAPATTKARFAPKLQPSYDDTWLKAAERGVFAFDGDFNGEPYRLVAAPQLPIRVDQLPEPARTVAKRLTFPALRFSALSEISNERLAEADS